MVDRYAKFATENLAVAATRIESRIAPAPDHRPGKQKTVSKSGKKLLSAGGNVIQFPMISPH
jgi:hypothetical protein